MKDELIKAMALNDHVRIYAISGTELVDEARRRFNMMPTSAAALGRVLLVGSMMGSMLKDKKEQLTIEINGGGPIGTIMVNGYHDGHVRGFVSDPEIHINYNDTGKLAVGYAVGTQGTLKVTKELHMSENWSGIVNLQSGEIGEDFAYYFAMSEQTPSAVSLGVLVGTDYAIESAGGLIIQMMPGASEAEIVECERVVGELASMSSLIKNNESLSDIVMGLFDDARILSSQAVEFRCDCSSATMKRALLTLTKDDRLEMIEADEGCEITCNFCNEEYRFTTQELIELENFSDKYGRSEVEH